MITADTITQQLDQAMSSDVYEQLADAKGKIIESAPLHLALVFCCAIGWVEEHEGPGKALLEANYLHRFCLAFETQIKRAAKALNVNPARPEPHNGADACPVCGCAPGERHDLTAHEAEP